MTQDITGRISRFVAELSYDALPENVLQQVALFVADYYAACLAGYRINRELNEKALLLMEQMGGCEQSTVLFSDKKMPACNAAFMNALYAHGADMDDGNRKAAGHIATHIMPAVFALAEAINAAWKDVITAVVAGYDVFNRIAGAAQPSLYNRGYHSTGVAGGPACAAACAKLLGLDAAGIYNAISLGALQASGLIIIDESGQECKPINPANAARTGILSAQLAQLGVKAPRNPLESKKGWFNAFSDGMDEEVLFDGLGETFTICESYLKLYPTCRHTHCSMDGVIAIRRQMEQDGFTPRDVTAIDLRVYPAAIKSTGNIPYPKTEGEAKFSLHYCTAAALLLGGFGLAQLDVASCPGAQELIPLVHLTEDPAMEDRARGIRGAVVRITLKSGDVYEQTVLTPKGEGSQPLDWTDMEQKMRQCAVGVCDEDRVAAILRQVRAISPAAPFSIPCECR